MVRQSLRLWPCPHLNGCLGCRAGGQPRNAIGQDGVGSEQGKPLRQEQANACQATPVQGSSRHRPGIDGRERLASGAAAFSLLLPCRRHAWQAVLGEVHHVNFASATYLQAL